MFPPLTKHLWVLTSEQCHKGITRFGPLYLQILLPSGHTLTTVLLTNDSFVISFLHSDMLHSSSPFRSLSFKIPFSMKLSLSMVVKVVLAPILLYSLCLISYFSLHHISVFTYLFILTCEFPKSKDLSPAPRTMSGV